MDKIFNARNLELITYHQESIKSLTPNPGWVEQDPYEILEKTILCIEKAVEQLEGLGYNRSDIKGRRKTKFKVEKFYLNSSCSCWCNKST